MSVPFKASYSHLQLSHSLTECPDPMRFERHCHALYELLYVVQGRGRYIVESAEYPLEPGTVLILRPYEFHYVCPDKDCPYERFVLNFDLFASSPMASSLTIMKKEEIPGPGVYFSAENVNSAVPTALSNMQDARALFGRENGNPAGEEELVRVLLTQILLLLSASKPAPVLSRDKSTVTRVLEYLNLHLTEELSLDALAQRFFVSKYHLCRAFREHTGVSVMTYFNSKRMALAQQMLSEGRSATVIAYQLGFRNYSTFYRAYCKHIGEAPVHRRK